MKYLAGAVLVVLVFSAYMSVSVEEAHAFGVSQPFGGLVTITTPGVTCDGGDGPYQQTPAGSVTGSALPYFYPTGTRSAPTAKQWVLGMYDSTPDTGDCHEDDEDDTPYTVYKVTLWGHSGDSSGSGIGSLFGSSGN